jgi:hypothetical protein
MQYHKEAQKVFDALHNSLVKSCQEMEAPWCSRLIFSTATDAMEQVVKGMVSKPGTTRWTACTGKALPCALPA